MRKVPRAKQSDRRKRMKAGNKDGDLGNCRDKFLSTDDPEKRLQIAEVVGRMKSDEHLLMAAEMCIEAACQNGLDVDNRLKALDIAESNLHETLRNHNLSGGSLASKAGRAMTQLVFMPQYRWLSLEGRLSPAEFTEDSYESLIDIATEYHASIETRKTSSTYHDHEQKGLLLGNLAELDVLLLLSRFAIKTDATDTYSAMPSFYSEDRAGGSSRGSYTVNRWDVSVWTQYDTAAAPQLAHKIQVKTSNNEWGKPQEYKDDIALVSVADDLSHNGKRISLQSIPINCREELHGNPHSPGILDLREALLLDRLD